MSDLARVLGAIQHGEPEAGDELLPLVYQELRRLSSSKMAPSDPLDSSDAKSLPDTALAACAPYLHLNETLQQVNTIT